MSNVRYAPATRKRGESIKDSFRMVKSIWATWRAAAFALGLLCVLVSTSLLGFAMISSAQQNPITAIDIALEPDNTMLEHAQAVNERLRSVFPKGFALDATHHPHISILQRYVRTGDLDKVYAAVDSVLSKENPAGWKLKAYKYYYIPWKDIGLAGIVAEPTADLLNLQ